MSAVAVERRLRPRGAPIAEGPALAAGAADLRQNRALGELVDWLASEQRDLARAAARVRSAQATIAAIEARIISELAGAQLAAVAGGRTVRVETSASPRHRPQRRVIRIASLDQ